MEKSYKKGKPGQNSKINFWIGELESQKLPQLCLTEQSIARLKERGSLSNQNKQTQ